MAGGPRCPNHQTILIRTNTPGVGICPVSSARFAYKADSSTKVRKVRTDGTITEEEKYIVEGSD